MFNKREEELSSEDLRLRAISEDITWKDVLAAIIAEGIIIAPFALAFVAIITVAMLFLGKVWLR